MPLKVSMPSVGRRGAPGQPLPAHSSRAPLNRGETDKPEGQTQSPRLRAAPSLPPLSLCRRIRSPRKPSPPTTLHLPTPFPPSSPTQIPEKKWEWEHGDACLAPALWEQKGIAGEPPESTEFSRSFCIQ